MLPEIYTQVWSWLLGLSKVELILLGGSLTLLVALSKVFRWLFLALVVLFLVVALPQLLTRDAAYPLPELIPAERAGHQDWSLKGDENGS